MKISYSNLQIELTRRCNQECAHCCRGDAQNVDLTEEIVDAFFEKNEFHSFGRLLFSGGEPTLNGKLLEYIVDIIIEKGILVESFMFGINGLSYSEELVRGLTKLRDYIRAQDDFIHYGGWLMISQDQFHKDADPEVLSKLKDLPYLSPVQKSVLTPDNILPYGRAYTNGLSTQEPNLEDLTDYEKKYKIVEYEGEKYLVISYQYISANGNVVNDGCQSYSLMDQYALGNVLDSKIEDIYLNKQKKKIRIS